MIFSKNSVATLLVTAQLFSGPSDASPTLKRQLTGLTNLLGGDVANFLQGLNLPICLFPLERKEWRTLSNSQKTSYINAVKCVQNKPPVTPVSIIPGRTSLYEDFVGHHIIRMTNIHNTGIFYPWHRWFTYLYEKEIRKCGYTGAQPYWDWELDAANLAASPIFDPVYGFGGNGEFVPGNFTNPAPGFHPLFDIPGHTGGGCIPNGPFQGLVAHLGPFSNINSNPRCVRRDFSVVVYNTLSTKANVDTSLAQTDYGRFARFSEDTTHNGGHAAIGGLYGDMIDVYASPSDPLFYLHHANVDRLWWSWQVRGLPFRLFDMSGNIVFGDFNNQAGGNVTLDTVMDFGAISPSTVKVREVMNILSSNLCYKYDKLY